MSEQDWIFLVGILVAVVAYFAKNFIFEPLLEFRKVRGRIQNSLKYNANKIFNTIDNSTARDFAEELRRLSCDLEEKHYAIAYRAQLHIFGTLPSADDISEISGALMFISNSLNEIESNKDKHEFYDTIKRKLKIL